MPNRCPSCIALANRLFNNYRHLVCVSILRKSTARADTKSIRAFIHATKLNHIPEVLLLAETPYFCRRPCTPKTSWHGTFPFTVVIKRSLSFPIKATDKRGIKLCNQHREHLPANRKETNGISFKGQVHLPKTSRSRPAPPTTSTIINC